MEIGYLPWVLAKHFGTSAAVADDSTSLSFEDLNRRTEAMAVQLAQFGIGPGDVVAVKLYNRVELVIALGAAWRLRAAVTPINPGFTAEETNYQLSDSAAKVVLAERPESGLVAPVLPLSDIVTATAQILPEPVLRGDDRALLVYTSGSTGKPKGVMLDHANCEAMSRMFAEHFRLTVRDHCLLVLPLFHVNAIMISTLAPLRVGGRLTVLPRFSASGFFTDFERIRPTYFSAVPAMYAMLASLPAEIAPDTSSLRFAVCGAAPASKELLEASQRRFGFTIIEGYGLTESTCGATCNPLDGVRKPGTVGPAFPGQRIKVVDHEGQEVPAGQAGEVLISGPTVMRGYLGRPEATAETVVDGWLHTGDVGVFDEDGYLRIVDRIKDMIIRGGENIYPKEIENTISAIDGVLEAAVVGAPDPILGEVPVAYVATYPGVDIAEEQILDHCRQYLSKAKIPLRAAVVETLPKNPVGKIDKPRLRQDLQLQARN
ncbi:AMP-binding protein [Streptomyces sp. NPDC002088]|uniref:class I adenylate-forming enzyme family protein n=1 Tax=Streptomyces sp. NPDC002088 TaxID=3154665 RepID=UPI0033273F93